MSDSASPNSHCIMTRYSRSGARTRTRTGTGTRSAGKNKVEAGQGKKTRQGKDKLEGCDVYQANKHYELDRTCPLIPSAFNEIRKEIRV